MVIRRASPEDIKTLQDLNGELLADNLKYDPDLKLEWSLSDDGQKYFTEALDNPNSVCLIAEENGRPVGYISATPREYGYRQSKYMEIDNMEVVADFRSKGIGSQLIDECLKIAREKGYQRAHVNAYYANTGAVNFYERGGFKRIDISLEKDL